MPRTPTAKIGRFLIPIRDAHVPNLWYFSCGARGRKEIGVYAFWTATLKKPFNGKRKLWGRQIVWLPAGDRFDRMKREMLSVKDADDRKIYRKYWCGLLACGRNVAYLRPSTSSEVKRWMATHLSDAIYARKIKVR